MIVYLHDSILNSIEQNQLNEADFNNLISIAQAKYNGKHFIIGDKTTIQAITNLEPLGDYIKSIYLKIFNDQTKWFNLLKDFDFKVVVRSDIDDFFTLKDDDKTEFHVPLKLFNTTNLNNHPDFICENLVDVKVYLNITNSYLKSIRVNGVKLSCNPVMGGGNTTHQVIQNNIESNKISACILDGDYKYPGCEIGATAKAVIDINNNNFSFVQLFVLKQRELENLLPISLLKAFFRKDQGQLIKLNEIERLKSLASDDFNPFYYIDLKFGLRKSVFSCVTDSLEKSFWLNILPEYSDFSCVKNNCKVSKCTNKHVDGFGSDLLQNIASHIEENELEFDQIDDDLKSSWIEICRFLISFFISPMPRVA